MIFMYKVLYFTIFNSQFLTYVENYVENIENYTDKLRNTESNVENFVKMWKDFSVHG